MEWTAGQSFGRAFENYDKCYEVLGTMVRFRCHTGCRSGGGPPSCGIRECCQKKGLEGCWECLEFESCTKLDFLKPVHDDGHIKNLRLLKRKGPAEFVRGKRHWQAQSNSPMAYLLSASTRVLTRPEPSAATPWRSQYIRTVHKRYFAGWGA